MNFTLKDIEQRKLGDYSFTKRYLYLNFPFS
jgi:hypothetical protein